MWTGCTPALKASEVESLLAKHRVRYVVVGPRERDTYPGLDVSGFEELMTAHHFRGIAPVTVYEWCGTGTGNQRCSEPPLIRSQLYDQSAQSGRQTVPVSKRREEQEPEDQQGDAHG